MTYTRTEFNQIKIDLKRGKDSGFPLCDRLWFVIRLFLMKFGWERNLFPVNQLSSNPNLWQRTWFKIDNALYEYSSHVICPFCAVKYWILGKIPVYYRCSDCNWYQLSHYSKPDRLLNKPYCFCNLCKKNISATIDRKDKMIVHNGKIVKRKDIKEKLVKQFSTKYKK